MGDPLPAPMSRRAVLVLAGRSLVIAGLASVVPIAVSSAQPVSPPAPGSLPSPTPRPFGSADAPLTPAPALRAVLDVLGAYPLVGLADRHGLQQEHDFIVTLLRSAELPDLIDDIVVEFGNPRLQAVADSFVVTGDDVSDDDLRQIWRQTGGTLWDAPVYERFFRTVREVNQALPLEQRIRVVLGDAPIDLGRVQSVADADYVRTMENGMDAAFADIVEREVLARGRRALLIAGGGHLRRGLHADIHPRTDDPGQPGDAGTLLEQRHPGALYVIDTLIVGYLDDLEGRVAANVSDWAAPALAPLDGTWLGEQTGPSISYRAMSPADARYGSQADAVLYLGPDDTLTDSLPDPAIYTGDYAAFLDRLTPIMSAVYGDQEDWLGGAIAYAKSDPQLFP